MRPPIARRAHLTQTRQYDGSIHRHAIVLVRARLPAAVAPHVVGELGRVVAHGVALKPGKPLCLAVVEPGGGRRPVPVAVLPGFPTSAIFTFHEFIAPVLRALADQDAAELNFATAIARYEELVAKVAASEPDISDDLRDAYGMSLLQLDLARLYRAAGAADKAAVSEGRVHAMWLEWTRAHPDNDFVRRQLALGASSLSAIAPPRP